MRVDVTQLIQGHRAFRPLPRLRGFLGLWLCWSLLICVINLSWLPIRAGVGQTLLEPHYYLETLGWAGLCLATAIALYYASFPVPGPGWPLRLCYLLLAALTLSAFGHSAHGVSIGEEFTQELSLWRGRCGFLILGVSLIQSLGLWRWARAGAPHSPSLAGGLAALSAAALGCLLMQIVCALDNPLHLILWHFVPLYLICALGLVLSARFLRW